MRRWRTRCAFRVCNPRLGHWSDPVRVVRLVAASVVLVAGCAGSSSDVPTGFGHVEMMIADLPVCSSDSEIGCLEERFAFTVILSIDEEVVAQLPTRPGDVIRIVLPAGTYALRAVPGGSIVPSTIGVTSEASQSFSVVWSPEG